MHHFYSYVQTFCLIYEICLQNTLQPTLWDILLPTPKLICGPLLFYYSGIRFIRVRFNRLFGLSGQNFWSLQFFYLLQCINPVYPVFGLSGLSGLSGLTFWSLQTNCIVFRPDYPVLRYLEDKKIKYLKN